MMTEAHERKVNILSQWISILGVPVAAAVGIFVMWNSANNVSKEEFVAYADARSADFDAYKKEQLALSQNTEKTLSGINTSIAVITQKMENDQRQEKRLDEHESRIRSLELAPRR